jgi:ribosomal 50S subunit-recycling heat shock protein
MPPMVAKFWKARVQLKKGDKSGATTTAQEGVKAATEMKSDEYIRLNTEVIAEAGKG